MPDADEKIILEIVVETDKAIQGTKEFRDNVDKLKTKLREVAKATGQDFKTAANGMTAAFEKTNTTMDTITGKIVKNTEAIRQFRTQMSAALREVQKEQKGATQSTRLFGIELSKLGDVGKFVFGSILGITAITAIREIIQGFKLAAQTAIEFSQELFKLGASTRALQRSGLDITIADVSEKIQDLRTEFSVFSRKDIVAGLAQMQLYTRQLGFTVEQMDQMIDAVVTLSIVMGKDFGETARSVALFLSSGYGEALQRAGIVDANRAAVAQELLALGFNKSFNEATQAERALAGLQIIMRGVADLSDETAAFTETLAGKTRELKSAWEDLILVMGQRLPINILLEGLIGLIEQIDRLTREATIRWALFWSPFLAGAEMATVAFQQFVQTIKGEEITIFQRGAFRDVVTLIRQEMLSGKGIMHETGVELGEDVAQGFAQGMEGELDVTRIVQEIADKIKEEAERLRSRLDAIARDVANDLARISRDTLNDIADIGRDLSQKLEDIAARLAQRIADAIRRAALQRAQVLRQAAIREAEINRKYRERELKAERDFQEAMRRLREDFLFDLEDALRERDALQVLRLTRRFNLEQERLRRERADEREDLERQRKEELEQLRIQTQERLRVLQEELQARLESLRIAAEREREQAIIEAQRRIEEEKRQEEERKREREIREKEQIEEEKKRAQERLEAYALELAEREGLTEDQINAFVETLKGVYGDGGIVQGIIKGLEQALLETNEAVAQSINELANAIEQALNRIKSLSKSITKSPTITKGSPGEGGYAEGGTLIANKPTTVTFGEAGMEAATFTPLTRIGKDEGKIFTDLAPVQDGGRSGFGKLALEIMLSRGLEASIIESALDEVADVIVNVQRKR